MKIFRIFGTNLILNLNDFTTIDKSEHRCFINHVANGDMEKVLPIHQKYGDKIAGFLWKGKHYPFYYAVKNGHYEMARFFDNIDKTYSTISNTDLFDIIHNNVNDWNNERNCQMLDTLTSFSNISDDKTIIYAIVRVLHYYPHRPFIQEGLCNWIVNKYGKVGINILLTELKESPNQPGFIKKIKRDIAISALIDEEI